jgi:hypothetical protein
MHSVSHLWCESVFATIESACRCNGRAWYWSKEHPTSLSWIAIKSIIIVSNFLQLKFSRLVFKSTALWRNLKWGVHTKCSCLYFRCITSFLTFSPCLRYLHITCQTFSFYMWTETAVKAINLKLCTLPCTLPKTEMKCTFILRHKYVWKVVTITGN